MKIEKERNSIKITYSACAPLSHITEMYESIAASSEGIYLPSDIQHGKEGVTLNIRHRESLQAYFEKNIFRIDDYIEVLKRLKAIVAALMANGYEPANCLWDVDAVFVGGSISELELVYLAEPESTELEDNSLTDFLAVMSLHVFDSRDSAIEALSDAVNEFAATERSGSKDIPGSTQFDKAISMLSSFSSGAGRVRSMIYCFWSKLKKRIGELFPGAAGKLPESVSAAAAVSPSPDHSYTAEEALNSEIRLFLKDDAGGPYFEYITSETEFDAGTHNKYGLESRLTKIDPVDEPQDTVVIDSYKKTREAFAIGRDHLRKRAGIFCPYVSRRHAQLIRRGGEYFLTDLESLNGTYLNGDRLAPGSFYRVVKGDVISLAHASMSFSFCM
jgi:hypothetical protein